MHPPLHILSISSLYPTPAQPGFGVFVENRLSLFQKKFSDVTLRVISPRPLLDRAPQYEIRKNLTVLRPHYVRIPGTSQYTSDIFIYKLLIKIIKDYIEQYGVPDIMDGHFLYPDGAAAARLGRHYHIPSVLTARGSDVTYWPNLPRPRRKILQAVADSAAVITVSEALRRDLIALGADPHRIITLRNGVDTDVFRPGTEPRRPEHTLLSVGHLIPRKGHDLAIAALPEGVTLHIIGEGPELRRLQDLAVGKPVYFHGAVPPEHMPARFAAADALILASSHEGMANVLLESMACGTPVIACDVGGAAEIITPEAGILVAQRTPEALRAAIDHFFLAPLPRERVRAHALTLSWDATLDGMHALFSDIVHRHKKSTQN